VIGAIPPKLPALHYFGSKISHCKECGHNPTILASHGGPDEAESNAADSLESGSIIPGMDNNDDDEKIMLIFSNNNNNNNSN
jgi:hypothetical protein